MSHGRIVEVCGDSIREIYSKHFATNPGEGEFVAKVIAASTVPFFGLSSCGDLLCAVASDGIHQIDAKGKAKIITLPPFKEVGGVGVSFDLPQAVLVVTRINQRVSVSGNVPLLVPRE